MYQNAYNLIITFILIFIAQCNLANSAAIKPRSIGAEGRFKTWTYYPNTVYWFMGYYMNPTYIEFENTETVSTISSAKPTAWQLTPSANRLFLKPVEDDADTTLTVMTNKRIYFFELHAAEARGPFDPNLTFFVKFRYPEQPQTASGDTESVTEYTSSHLPDLSNPDKYNFNYTISGDEIISPNKIFDDNRFTYMHFANDSKVALPAIFVVDNLGFESLINFRVVGNYIVIERVASIFTLRSGSDTVCVFNETQIHPMRYIPKKK